MNNTKKKCFLEMHFTFTNELFFLQNVISVALKTRKRNEEDEGVWIKVLNRERQIYDNVGDMSREHSGLHES